MQVTVTVQVPNEVLYDAGQRAASYHIKAYPDLALLTRVNYCLFYIGTKDFKLCFRIDTHNAVA
jgi:hypothetical protein